MGVVCVEGGYKTVSPIQILNAVGLDSISTRALRVYLASFELQAKREAATRSRRAVYNQIRGKGRVLFREEELAELSLLPLRAVKKSLRELARASLLQFSSEQIVVTETALPEARELIEKGAGRGRHATRPIPVPRRLLRYLSRCETRSLLLTILAYLVRGLSIHKKTGEVNPRGTVKASWIAETFGLSLRSVRRARAEMVELGLISRDENSVQWKLNRDGSYFEINLNWVPAREEKSADLGPGSVENEAPLSAQNEPHLAPPPAQNEPHLAPPYRRLKTPNGSKNQKPMPGFSKEKSRKGELPPTIWNVQAHDLRSISRTEELFRQAVRQQLLPETEAAQLNFFAAAVRARAHENAPRIFMGIVRRQLWHHITQAEEEAARAAINRRREQPPSILQQLLAA